jgi:hypothetical protein
MRREIEVELIGVWDPTGWTEVVHVGPLCLCFGIMDYFGAYF